MKKGKANVPPQMRQQYKRAQEMENYRKQMMDSQNAGSDGLPVFNLFVRTSLKNVSYLLLFEQKADMAYFTLLPPFSSPICSHIINLFHKLLTHTPFSLVTTSDT
jgi:hypothetical protein